MINNNNKVRMSGIVINPLEFNYEICAEKFYSTTLEIKRLSDAVDRIPVLISERIIDVDQNWIGRTVEIIGQVRTYNLNQNGKTKVMTYVFALDFCELEAEANCNDVDIEGYLCKAPNYRTTPLGRDITDLVIAVNRAYGKTDCVHCVCWGRNAKFAQYFNSGDKVSVSGRIQNREYIKRLSDDKSEVRTAYEVSASKVELLEVKEWT